MITQDYIFSPWLFQDRMFRPNMFGGVPVLPTRAAVIPTVIRRGPYSPPTPIRRY
jgi:hypothetical protein